MSTNHENSKSRKSKSYAESGVDVQAADKFVEQIQGITGRTPTDARLKGGIGAYAAVYEWTPESWMAVGCDGVGTKILWTLKGLGSAEDLAQDLVAMSVNDLLCVGARPQLFLDYVGFTDGSLLEDGGLLPQFIQGLQSACARSGAFLVGGETAQMPGFYHKDHFDVSGFCVGQLDPEDWLHADKIQEDSVLWAWKSDGPHANGFSWLRDVFDADSDAEWIRHQLMAPTRLYVNEMQQLKSLLAESSCSEALQAAYHITGGGLRNLLRLQPEAREVGFELFEREDYPEWFVETQKRTESSLKELLCSFNAGWGLLVLIDRAASDRLAEALQNIGLEKVGRSTSVAQVKMGDMIVSLKD